eukprot:CAMPEP_0177638420 /NCGR_PEP_ID=MMETSP0447-20121125/5478_1 /TAXON_ID=0 /ORGANISM="Stygamoeba regulata, Strain BSH-02190019" /LENGTH=102 /DNA_ID=CAMNT_0019140379 /DNA_START=152 /DNA_END=461 /DNA_ORIENTATION=-
MPQDAADSRFGMTQRPCWGRMMIGGVQHSKQARALGAQGLHGGCGKVSLNAHPGCDHHVLEWMRLHQFNEVQVEVADVVDAACIHPQGPAQHLEGLHRYQGF